MYYANTETFEDATRNWPEDQDPHPWPLPSLLSDVLFTRAATINNMRGAQASINQLINQSVSQPVSQSFKHSIIRASQSIN